MTSNVHDHRWFEHDRSFALVKGNRFESRGCEIIKVGRWYFHKYISTSSYRGGFLNQTLNLQHGSFFVMGNQPLMLHIHGVVYLEFVFNNC